MLQYNEFHARMRAIQDVLNTAADHATINTTGETTKETALHIIGRYIQTLSSATMPSFFAAKMLLPVSILIHAKREFSDDKQFDFFLFDKDVVEQDDAVKKLWLSDFTEYTRMTSCALVGAAASIGRIDDVVVFERLDFGYWCNIQAMLLAKYCVAHDVDFTRFVDMV